MPLRAGRQGVPGSLPPGGQALAAAWTPPGPSLASMRTATSHSRHNRATSTRRNKITADITQHERARRRRRHNRRRLRLRRRRGRRGRRQSGACLGNPALRLRILHPLTRNTPGLGRRLRIRRIPHHISVILHTLTPSTLRHSQPLSQRQIPPDPVRGISRAFINKVGISGRHVLTDIRAALAPPLSTVQGHSQNKNLPGVETGRGAANPSGRRPARELKQQAVSTRATGYAGPGPPGP